MPQGKKVMQSLAETTINSDLAHVAPDCGPRRWFAVFTRSHHEKHVARYLTERGVENFLPLYRSERSWSHGRKPVLDLPLFPNYLFVHIAGQEYRRALATPGVVTIVGRSHASATLPDFEMERLRSGLIESRVAPHPYLATGTRVRITSGPLAGLEGIFVRERNAVRVVLTIDVIQQSMSVEVGSNDVRPI
jgi:transcription antitermination factor NusG